MHAHQHASIPPEKITTYRHIRTLADRATIPGERDQALRTLAKLRATYPGIEHLAAEAEQQEQRAQNAGNPHGFSGVSPAQGFNFASWLDMIKRTYSNVSTFLDEIHAGLQTANTAAEMCKQLDKATAIDMKQVRIKGKGEIIRITVDWPVSTLSDVLEARVGDEALTNAIVEHVASRFAAKTLAKIIHEYDEEDEEDEEE